MKTILIVGASGSTGRLLTQQLLERGHHVKVIVRSPEKLPGFLKDHGRLTIIPASVLDLTDEEMAHNVSGCDAVASCLGHNLNFKGLYGKPRRLVTDAARRLCSAIRANNPAKPVRYVLMNTVGNKNRDLEENTSTGHNLVFALLRLLLPPQVDNEKAADHLRTEIGQQDSEIEWVAVRPDTLINEENVTEYELHPSPVRSPIFNPGKTSRINVGHFMAELITNDDLWKQWKGQMPVIYNKGFGA